jgi:ribosomal-protein-serine acetyltransferase
VPGVQAMFRMPIDKSLDLALLEHRHAGMLYAVIDENRDHLRRYLPWVDNTRSVHDSVGFVQATLEQFARSQSLSAGIFFHGALAGVIGYHTIDWANRRTALGYWLSASFQGHGIMTRAVRAMTTHAFTALSLHRMEIRAAVDNKRSRTVAERAGYRHEGVCRGAEWLHDRFVDHAVYGVTAPDWKA